MVDRLVGHDLFDLHEPQRQHLDRFRLDEDRKDLGGDIDRSRDLGVLGAGPDVGGGDDAGMGGEWIVDGRFHREHVEAGTGDRRVVEGGQQRRLVDDGAARSVDQLGGRHHRRQLGGTDQTLGVRSCRDVKCHVVRLGQQVVEVDRLHLVFQVELWSGAMLIGDDGHPERLGAGGHLLSDPAETDDAERLARQTGSHQLRLLPAAVLHRRVGPGDVACECEHQPERQLGHRHAVGVRAVDHLDAGVHRRLHIDGVETGPGPCDHLEPTPVGDDPGRDACRRSDDDGLVLIDDVHQRVLVEARSDVDLTVAGEQLDAGIGDRVAHQNPRAMLIHVKLLPPPMTMTCPVM